MNQVFTGDKGVITADRSGRGLGNGVSSAAQLAPGGNGRRAFQNTSNNRSRGDEVHQWLVKVRTFVCGIVLVG